MTDKKIKTAKQYFQAAKRGFYYVNYYLPKEDMAFYKRWDGRIQQCHANVAWQLLAEDQYPNITLKKLEGAIYTEHYPVVLGYARTPQMLEHMKQFDPGDEVK